MSKKIGRPLSEKPKDVIVKTRIDSATVKKLDGYCDKYDVNRSEVIREGINKVLENKE